VSKLALVFNNHSLASCATQDFSCVDSSCLCSCVQFPLPSSWISKPVCAASFLALSFSALPCGRQFFSPRLAPAHEFALLQRQLQCLASDFRSLAKTALRAHLISSAARVCRVSRARLAQIFVPASRSSCDFYRLVDNVYR
jgi:hypothetical protein